MAQTHTELVETLEATLGREEAVKIGQRSLFSGWERTWANKPATSLESAITEKI